MQMFARASRVLESCKGNRKMYVQVVTDRWWVVQAGGAWSMEVGTPNARAPPVAACHKQTLLFDRYDLP